MIIAGALLKDNQTGEVLAQLKFKNISIKNIKAIKVAIDAFDISGEKIEGVPEYQYLDLDEYRDAEFGHKSAIRLPENTTRTFVPRVTGVFYADNTSWHPRMDASWEPIRVQQKLEEVIKDNEIKKQYEIETGVRCTYSPLKASGLWFCTCGAINHDNQGPCHVCGVELSILEDKLKDESLELRKNSRLENESQETRRLIEQAENDRQKRKKKQKKLIAIMIPAIVLAVLTMLFTVVVPRVRNEKTIDLIESTITKPLKDTVKNDVFADFDLAEVNIEYESKKVQGNTFTFTGVMTCTFKNVEQKVYIPFSAIGTVGTTKFNCTFGEGYVE